MSKPSSVKRQVRKALRAIGFDLIRYQPSSHPLAKRIEQMRRLGINLVLDVGANIGQYGWNIRDLGYQGRIVSFEPLSDAFQELEKNVASDANWDAHHYALGNEDGTQEIHIAENSWSSSLLSVTNNHIAATPESRTVDNEMIEVRRLDSVFEELCSDQDKVLLKIDTQGFEKHVLEGAEESLPRIQLIQLELSFAPLYEGQPLFNDMYQWLSDRSYQLACIEEPWWDRKTGQLMQVDGVFQRTS